MKKQIKHFVSNKDMAGMGVPVCNGFGFSNITQSDLPALPEEVAKTRKHVTCKNCRRTRVFRKLKMPKGE